MSLLWKACIERGTSKLCWTIQPKACYPISGRYTALEDFSCNQNGWKQYRAATQQDWVSRAKNSAVHLTAISSYYFFWQLPLKRQNIIKLPQK